MQHLIPAGISSFLRSPQSTAFNPPLGQGQEAGWAHRYRLFPVQLYCSHVPSKDKVKYPFWDLFSQGGEYAGLATVSQESKCFFCTDATVSIPSLLTMQIRPSSTQMQGVLTVRGLEIRGELGPHDQDLIRTATHFPPFSKGPSIAW